MIDIKARSAETMFRGDTSSPAESVEFLMTLYSKHRAVTIWLDRCPDDMTAKIHEQAFLDQIDQMKRESQVQSNVERLR